MLMVRKKEPEFRKLDADLERKITLVLSSPLGIYIGEKGVFKDSPFLADYLLDVGLAAYYFDSLREPTKSFMNAAIFSANELDKVLNDSSYRADRNKGNQMIVEKTLAELSVEDNSKVEEFARLYFDYTVSKIASIEAKIKGITNKSRYLEVDFLPESEIRQIGDVGGTPLVILGFEKGTKTPIISKDIDGENYHAMPVYELISHSQEPINITERFN
jgi:hypothetical protein